MKNSGELVIVYDEEGCSGAICDMVSEIKPLLEQCVHVQIESLFDWEAENNERGADSNPPKLYIASLETDEFHSKVKPAFLSSSSRCLMVLVYSNETKMSIKRLEKGVKSIMKKKEPIDEIRKAKVQEKLDQIVKLDGIGQLEQTSFWWPHVLKLVQSAQPVVKSRDAAKRQLGIFFKINPDNREQLEWCENQSKVLKSLFKVQCRHTGGGLDEEIYIKSAIALVMYADRSSYQNIGNERLREEGKLKMLESIKQTKETCARYGTKFHVFVNEAGVKLTNIINNQTGMKMIGHGMFCHFVELLALLGKLHVTKKEEQIFYSMHRDRHPREVFNPSNYRGLLPMPREAKTPREGFRREASIGDILMQNTNSNELQGVCYQPISTVDTEQDGLPNVTCVSCFQRFRRR